MRIRDLTLNDLRVLEGSQNGFKMPNVCNPLYFSQIVVIDESEAIIGAAFIHLTTEVSLILRKDISDFRKTKALIPLVEEIKKIHRRNDLEDSHVFLTGDDGRFARFLEKQGFVRATGTPMYYQELS